MNDTAPTFSFPQHRKYPVWLRFALLCTLFLLAAVRLEPHLGPICRATAAQVAAILRLAGYVPVVRDDLITLAGFSVRIVGECTAIHPVLLLVAFALATPATWGRRASGMLLGGAFLMTVNILRIAAITTVGAARPELFQILHVYLGQVIMLLLVMATALVWQRHNSGTGNPFPFLLRALAIATLLYLPWLAFNLTYMELIDNCVIFIFSLFKPAYLVTTPRPFTIYNHTFSVPLLLALILASGNLSLGWRLAGSITGVLVLAAWHALFRSSHVLWTAFDLPVASLHETIYLIGQFLLPFLIWKAVACRGLFSRNARPSIIQEVMP